MQISRDKVSLWPRVSGGGHGGRSREGVEHLVRLVEKTVFGPAAFGPTNTVVAAILLLLLLNMPMLLTRGSGVLGRRRRCHVTQRERESARQTGREKAKKRFGRDVMSSDSLVFGIESMVALLY